MVHGTISAIVCALFFWRQIDGVALTHDRRANTTNDGAGNQPGFYATNQLETIDNNTGRATFGFDPMDRIYSATSPSGVRTRFLFDGADMIAEYDDSGVVTHRYVHGPGVDEPLVWLVGDDTNDRQWLVADERGSIIATTDDDGDATVNQYGPYGEPASSNQGHYQYTGQMWLAEAGADLYYYKARIYSASLGRFLSVDPIGYADSLNPYAYVGNDPINFTDPWGLERITIDITCASDHPCSAWPPLSDFDLGQINAPTSSNALDSFFFTE